MGNSYMILLLLGISLIVVNSVALGDQGLPLPEKVAECVLFASVL